MINSSIKSSQTIIWKISQPATRSSLHQLLNQVITIHLTRKISQSVVHVCVCVYIYVCMCVCVGARARVCMYV